MLVLSRKKNESIIINDNITVTVIEIRGDKVRLASRPRRTSRSIAARSTRRSRTKPGRTTPAPRSRRRMLE